MGSILLPERKDWQVLEPVRLVVGRRIALASHRIWAPNCSCIAVDYISSDTAPGTAVAGSTAAVRSSVAGSGCLRAVGSRCRCVDSSDCFGNAFLYRSHLPSTFADNFSLNDKK